MLHTSENIHCSGALPPVSLPWRWRGEEEGRRRGRRKEEEEEEEEEEEDEEEEEEEEEEGASGGGGERSNSGPPQLLHVHIHHIDKQTGWSINVQQY